MYFSLYFSRNCDTKKMESCCVFEWLSIIVILFFFLYRFCTVRFTYWKNLNVDTIKDPDFIFGHVKDIFKGKTSYQKQLADWYKQYKGLKMIGAYDISTPFLVVFDPELLSNILVKDFDHFQDHYATENKELDPLSENIFFLSTDKWKELRKKITPIFTPAKLKNMFDTILECSIQLDNCLNRYVDNSEPVDIKQIATKYTTNIVGSCFFGIETDCFNNSDNVFSNNVLRHLTPSASDRLRLYLNHAFPNFCKIFHIRQINKKTDEFFRSFVYENVEYRNKNDVERNDFLQQLLDLRTNEETKLSLNQIAAQTFIFFIGGFETSSALMSFCLYELAKNPSVQEKTRQEVLSVLKKYDNQICYEAIRDMSYLERVLLGKCFVSSCFTVTIRLVVETSRKHPSLEYLTRRVTKDYHVPNSDVVLKKGLAVFIPSLGLHYDPEYYPDPDVFDPDRFTFENRTARPEATHLAFGIGQRICIGSKIINRFTPSIIIIFFYRDAVWNSTNQSRSVSFVT